MCSPLRNCEVKERMVEEEDLYYFGSSPFYSLDTKAETSLYHL